MKRITYILSILALVFTGCASDPVANFAFTPADPIAGEDVFFENLSMDAESFEWNFDDGTKTFDYSPAHRFLAGGTYVVELKAFGKRGGMDVAIAEINVMSIQPTAEFSVYTDLPGDDGPVAVETDLVFVGEQVEFYNTSLDGESYLWDFDDGYTSELESPVYSFDTPGVYDVTLYAYGLANEEDTYTKTIEVVEGINSALRITVLEFYDEYPVEGASVILYQSVSDWEQEIDPTQELFTTPLGKCAYEGLNFQRYYVDVWEQDHDNYTLAAESVDFIETQPLEPGYIHDFVAYVDYYTKKMTLTRVAKKAWTKEQVSLKKAGEMRTVKKNKFSKRK